MRNHRTGCGRRFVRGLGFVMYVAWRATGRRGVPPLSLLNGRFAGAIGYVWGRWLTRRGDVMYSG